MYLSAQRLEGGGFGWGDPGQSQRGDPRHLELRVALTRLGVHWRNRAWRHTHEHRHRVTGCTPFFFYRFIIYFHYKEFVFKLEISHFLVIGHFFLLPVEWNKYQLATANKLDKNVCSVNSEEAVKFFVQHIQQVFSVLFPSVKVYTTTWLDVAMARPIILAWVRSTGWSNWAEHVAVVSQGVHSGHRQFPRRLWILFCTLQHLILQGKGEEVFCLLIYSPGTLTHTHTHTHTHSDPLRTGWVAALCSWLHGDPHPAGSSAASGACASLCGKGQPSIECSPAARQPSRRGLPLLPSSWEAHNPTLF